MVLLSLTDAGKLRIERTYYAMICEIDAAKQRVTFHTTADIG